MKRIGDIVQVVDPHLGIGAGIVLTTHPGNALTLRVFTGSGTDTIMRELPCLKIDTDQDRYWREVQ